MMLLGSKLKGFTIEADDGTVGTVDDLLFDDTTMRIRWLVIDTGAWLSSRRLLLHPSSVGQVDPVRRQVFVKLTMERIKASPTIATDQPVSMQMESAVYGHYGWNPLWNGNGFLGNAIARPLSMPSMYHDAETMTEDRAGDPHLRSVSVLIDYHIHANDGVIGHLQDVAISDTDWMISYFIIDTRNWWAGQHVLISPHAVREINWAERVISLDLSRDKIRASPPWTPDDRIDGPYIREMHSHYAWPEPGW